MATTGPFLGDKILVTIDGSAIGHINSHTTDYSRATSDTSSQDSNGYKEYIYSWGDGTMTFESLVVYDDDTAADKKGFFDLFNEGMLGDTVFTLVVGTEEAGDSVTSQKALLTSLSLNATMGERASYSGGFQFSGRPTVITNP